MYNAKTAYARYSAKNALKTASAEVTLKRKLENEIDEQSKNDSRLTEMKEQEDILAQHEEDSKKTKEKALLKMKEAQELMERAQKMDKLIANKKQSIEEKKDKIKKRILDSACQKAAKNLRSIIDDGPSTSKKDMNNNNDNVN